MRARSPEARARGRPARGLPAAALLAGVVAALPLATGLGSCALEYGAADSGAERPALPDTVLYSFQHTVVRNGGPLFRLIADRAENYDSQRRSLLYGVGFVEYGDGGKVVTAGTCASATFHTDTEDVELSGSIDFRSSREGMGIKAEYLYWDSAKRLLSSRPELVVKLEKDDGSAIRGEGFNADGRTRSWSFEANVEGTYATAAEGPE